MVPASLRERFPPSAPCRCAICRAYCQRPGWWTVEEVERAIEAGYGNRMMLELAPDRAYGVVAPAFRGNECGFALQEHAAAGCTFLEADRCALFGTGCQPLECRFCHHERRGQGARCHAAVARDWKRTEGRALVAHWCKLTGLWDHLERYGLGRLKDSR